MNTAPTATEHTPNPFSYSPAPWRVTQECTSAGTAAFDAIRDADNRIIATTYAGPGGRDATLMAAAPAMLAFVRRTLGRMYGERACFLEAHTVGGDLNTLAPEDAQYLHAINLDINNARALVKSACGEDAS